MEGEVELLIRGHDLVIHKTRCQRARWAEAFRRMAQLGDNVLLDRDSLAATAGDKEEWEWK
jgi:hypothetical protein